MSTDSVHHQVYCLVIPEERSRDLKLAMQAASGFYTIL